jgi:streptogrisin D
MPVLRHSPLVAAAIIGCLAVMSPSAANADTDLNAALSQVIAEAPIGSSAYVDATTNSVILRAPESAGSVTPARTSARVKVERTPAVIATDKDLPGGRQITYGDKTCTSGFLARKGSGPSAPKYVITAGHCTKATADWKSDGVRIGPAVDASFPTDDFGTIHVNSAYWQPRPSVIKNGVPVIISGATTPGPGSSACKTGRTTGTTCGTILATNVSVRYTQGVVDGLLETNVCTRPGDSGGPLYGPAIPFQGDVAMGIVSGSTKIGCDAVGYRSYHQPVQEILSSLGLTLLPQFG